MDIERYNDSRRDRRKYSIIERQRNARETHITDMALYDNHDIEWVDLPEPLHVGFEKCYKLRDDYTRRKDVANYEALLELVNTTIRSRTKTFMVKANRSKKLVPMEHTLKSFNPKEFAKVPDKLKKYFYTWYDYKWAKFHHTLSNPYFFVTTIRKRIITRVPKHNSEFESKCDRLDNYITTNNIRRYMYKEFGWRSHCSWDSKDAEAQRCKNIREERVLIKDVLTSYDYQIPIKL
jgi:hypothetical protein